LIIIFNNTRDFIESSIETSSSKSLFKFYQSFNNKKASTKSFN